MPIAEKDRPTTAFVVPPTPGFAGGLFQFNRMCFGLTNAPATFCRVVDKIFGDSKQRYCLLCIDDFSVYTETVANHMAHLEEVLKRLRDSDLKVKPKKCESLKLRFLVMKFQSMAWH